LLYILSLLHYYFYFLLSFDYITASQQRTVMSGEYHNVEWDVHATTDVYTPRNEIYDPLSAFTDSEVSLQRCCSKLTC
jgi:hypothetical protein